MRTLQELSDLEDIRELRLEYTHCMDSGDLEGLLDLYTDDAVCDFANFGLWRGKEEMRRGWTPYVIRGAEVAPWTSGRHVVTNPRIRVDGDRAHGEWFLIDLTFRQRGDRSQMNEQPIALFGMYEDEYVRTPRGWKMAKTTLHFYWPNEGGGPARLVRGD